jgi:hypothetical protein
VFGAAYQESLTPEGARCRLRSWADSTAVRPLGNRACEGVQVIQAVGGSAMHESEIDACMAMGDPIAWAGASPERLCDRCGEHAMLLESGEAIPDALRDGPL